MVQKGVHVAKINEELMALLVLILVFAALWGILEFIFPII